MQLNWGNTIYQVIPHSDSIVDRCVVGQKAWNDQLVTTVHMPQKIKVWEKRLYQRQGESIERPGDFLLIADCVEVPGIVNILQSPDVRVQNGRWHPGHRVMVIDHTVRLLRQGILRVIPLKAAIAHAREPKV
jgi:hypothetical protein